MEAAPYPERFQPAPPPFDVLVAAGDVWKSNVGRALDTLVRLASDGPAVCVLSDHERWDSAVHRTRALAGKDSRRQALLQTWPRTRPRARADGVEHGR